MGCVPHYLKRRSCSAPQHEAMLYLVRTGSHSKIKCCYALTPVDHTLGGPRAESQHATPRTALRLTTTGMRSSATDTSRKLVTERATHSRWRTVGQSTPTASSWGRANVAVVGAVLSLMDDPPARLSPGAVVGSWPLRQDLGEQGAPVTRVRWSNADGGQLDGDFSL